MNNTTNTRNHAAGEQLKANRRMSGWARNRRGFAHKLIRAYLISAGRRDHSTVSEIEILCTDPGAPLYIEHFDAWFRDLQQEGGNASGHVFDVDEHNRVTIWPPIQARLDEHRAEFMY